MTTIAWDGETLAADSRSTGCYIDQSNYQKIHLIGNTYIGIAGTLSRAHMFLRWYKDQSKPKPAANTLEGFEALVIRKGKAYFYDNDLEPIVCGTPTAIGSGSDCAMGAMLAGADAIQAVKIAKKLDTHTGGKIRSVKIK